MGESQIRQSSRNDAVGLNIFLTDDFFLGVGVDFALNTYSRGFMLAVQLSSLAAFIMFFFTAASQNPTDCVQDYCSAQWMLVFVLKKKTWKKQGVANRGPLARG